MAKSRAQRKAERRKREAREARQAQAERRDESRAQHDTQVPESADVVEAELAERGADVDALREQGESDGKQGKRPKAPAPSRADAGKPSDVEEAPKESRRERKRREREEEAAKEERRRAREKKPEVQERERGAVAGFIASCWAELKRVQWPDRETLIQASAVTIIFVALMALYLGVLDAAFSKLVDLFIS